MFSLSGWFLEGFGERLGIYLMGVNGSGDWEGGAPGQRNLGEPFKDRVIPTAPNTCPFHQTTSACCCPGASVLAFQVS